MAFDPQGRGGASGNDDLYEVLGLTPDATPDEVDAAYHRLLSGLTSAGANSPAAAETLRRRRIRLANAYAVLADPDQRAAYDERMGLQAAAPAVPDRAVPDAAIPPLAMPEVTPRTAVPPTPMPEVTPRTAIPPMPMPEVSHPEPAQPRRPTPAPRPTPTPAPPAASPAETRAATAAPSVAPEAAIPAAGLPPMAMPEVTPRTAVPPMPMPEVTPRTAVPPMPMPEVRHPEPVRPGRANPVVHPVPATPLADLSNVAEDGEEQRLSAPAEDLLAADVGAPVGDEAAPAEDNAADSPAGPDADAEEPPPVDDTPAPWETSARRAPAAPVVKPRPAARRPTAPAPAPAPVPPARAGGVALPSRKVAEATPLPTPRSRFVAPDAPTQPLDIEAENEPPINRARPAARPTPALPPIKARPAAAPVRRAPRKSRTNTLQTIFYGGMALILAIGTIAGIITSVGLPLGSTGALTPTIGSTSAALAQADALLAAGQYSQAIELYNQVLTATNGSDPKALLGLAKAYYFKTPSEPDIARQYLAQVFTSTSGSNNSPEAQEALQLLSQIGLPGTTTAGTPGANGTPGAAGTPVPATGGGTPGLPTAATGTTPLPPTQAAPAGAPGASTPTQ